MNFTLDRIEKKTPFSVTFSKPPMGVNNPVLIIYPAQTYDEKSKALGRGFVFSDRDIAIEIVGRLLATVILKWPDTAPFFHKITAPQETKHA